MHSLAGASAAPIRASALRALDVPSAAAFVESLGVPSSDSAKLAREEVDGAALLEMTVAELRSYGVLGGAAHRIMRATAEAQSATLTIFPPKGRKGDPNNPHKVALTPELFHRTFSPQAPLRLLNSSGSFLRVVTSLEEAAEASGKGLFLHASRRYDDDLAALNGFVTNSATAIEIKSTLAIAGSALLRGKYGPLALVNEGQVVELALSRSGRKSLELAPDGLIVAPLSSVVLLNSAKHTPSASHIGQVVEDAGTLEQLLAGWGSVATDPAEAKAQFPMSRGKLRVVPFLSGDNFCAAVAAKCRESGVGVVRPGGEGFLVEAAECAPPSKPP